MKVKAILFDWGGTLAQVVSQNERLTDGAREAARILGADGDEACVANLIRRVIDAETVAAADPEHREGDLYRCIADWAAAIHTVNEDELARASAALGEAWIGSLEAFPGVHETLSSLRKRDFCMGLVSNCMVPPPWCDREFERLGLAPLLDFTVFSSQVGYRKPSLVIYYEALKRVMQGRSITDMSQILFVGDSPAFDVMAPAQLGMKTALVRCHRGIWASDDYERAKPDLRLDSVNELPDLLA